MKKSLKHAILIFFSSATVLFIIFSPIFFKKDQVKSSNQNNIVLSENIQKDSPSTSTETTVQTKNQTENNSKNNSKKNEEPVVSENSRPNQSNEQSKIAEEEIVEVSSIQVNQPSSSSIPSPSSTTIVYPTPVAQEFITVEIRGTSYYQSYQVEIKDNDTAFSVLKRAAEENNFTISYQSYGSLGAFIDCLAGVCGSNNSYWAFYYNGEYSAVGASSQLVGDGDITSWRLED